MEFWQVCQGSLVANTFHNLIFMYYRFQQSLSQRIWRSITAFAPQDLILTGIIVIVTFWGYYSILDDFFIMDDLDMIQGHSTFAQFLKHWYSPVGANSYRPLADLLFIWDFHWWGWNPVGWHLTGVLFHLINSVLIYVLAKRLLNNRYAGFIAGMLFGLHASHAEAVTWISARMDVFCATCFLLSVLYFIAFLETRQISAAIRVKSVGAYGLSLGFFLCALLIKEMAVTLPLMLILYDLIFFRRRKARIGELLKHARLYAPYFLLLAVYFVVRYYTLHDVKYDSTLRSSIGGYQIPLFGAFLLTHLVEYMKLLAMPLTADLFSISLALNLAGIAAIAIPCLALSKESRFATLWVFVTLLPVYPMMIVRGVYLPSIGFCLFLSLLFTFSSHAPLKIFRIGLRTVQVVVCLTMFASYGVALKASNGWWSEASDINKTIPLMVKAMRPSFPPDAYLCLQNVPLVFNQRLSASFRFWFSGDPAKIYTERFEECVKNQGSDSLKNAFFFYYDQGSKTLSDVTPETSEMMSSPDRMATKWVSQSVSAAAPRLDVTFKTGESAAALGMVTSLANGRDVPQGTIVARGRIDGEQGVIETFELIAGQDTAEWAIRFPQIREQARHDAPNVFRAWTVRQTDDTFFVAQNYLKYIRFQRPFTLKKLTVEFLVSANLPPNLTVDVNRLILYAKRESPPL